MKDKKIKSLKKNLLMQLLSIYDGKSWNAESLLSNVVDESCRTQTMSEASAVSSIGS